MTVSQLLIKEKGKYTNYELHYKEYAKYIPFTFINGRKYDELEVVDYFYQSDTSYGFNMKLEFKGKKQDHTLIIVWKRKDKPRLEWWRKWKKMKKVSMLTKVI